ncbi:putative AAA domain-containing protein [Azospirillaceae bacterium]
MSRQSMKAAQRRAEVIPPSEIVIPEAPLPPGSPQPIPSIGAVELATTLAGTVVHREKGMPPIVMLTGVSGMGKSVAARYAAEKFGGYYVAADEMWSAATMITDICKEVGISVERPGGAAYKALFKALVEYLKKHPGKIIVIDEFDKAVKRRLTEIVRDLVDKSGCALLIVGEETLPKQLEKLSHERFRNRIVSHNKVERCTLKEARELAQYYSKDIKIKDDLLERMVSECNGVTRRIRVSISWVVTFADGGELAEVGCAEFGGRSLFTQKI